jgi:hypothetical protein
MLACLPVLAAELKPKTVAAFDQYIKDRESEISAELRPGQPFLWVDALPEQNKADAYRRLHRGEVLIQSRATGLDVPGGLIHDWTGMIFIPGASLDKVLTQLQNYDNDHRVYAPAVVRSQLLRHEGDHFIVLRRLTTKRFTTVVLDVVNDIEYFRMGKFHAASRSRAIRVSEIENPGTATERELPSGHDRGYLWRLNTYGRYLQADGGVYVQFEAIALSRGIPTGLGWLVKPFVTKVPKSRLPSR